MLGKLFKHELRAMSRIMLPITAALVVLAGLSNISVRFMDNVKSTFLELLLVLFVGLFIIGMIAAAIVLLVVVVGRFYNNFLKTEGYLMFTLPVNTHELVWSKLLASMLWTFITMIVMYGLILLTVWNSVSMSQEFINSEFHFQLNGLLRYLSNELGITGGDMAVIIIEGLLGGALGMIGGYLHFYTAMSIGQSFANHKVLMSVVFYLLINFAVQLFGPFVLELAGDGLFSIEIAPDISAINAVKIGLLVSCGIELIYDGILYVVTILFLNKKLNLA